MDRANGNRPKVFLLPGIMGSNLTVNGKRVWLDYFRLFMGGLGDLTLAATGVAPDQPLDHYYGRLARFLAADGKRDVIPFGFDWRLSLRVEARRFAAQLAGALATTDSPVHIVAHSMGGLLARAAFAADPELWVKFKASQGRLLFLGTPNGGSYEILRVLTGQSHTMKQLALLDVRHSGTDLVQIVGRFPGTLEMLPAGHFTPNPFIPIAPEDLAIAAETRALLDRTIFDPGHMIYVAGSAPSTACGMTVAADGTITFQATNHGDGSVEWASGIPSALTPYYATVGHADLPNHPPDFPAILELLETGATRGYSSQPVVSRGNASEVQRFALPADPDGASPTEENLAAAILGGAATEPAAAGKVQVSITHGNLAFARYPVVAGHYDGDSIVGAESQLDRLFQGRLKKRSQLGIYPARIGEAEIFSSNERKAIVIGLGRVGDLKPAALERTFREGMLKFALDAGETKLKLSPLLIGTALPLATSISAMVSAVAGANAELARIGSDARFTAIEFVELWEDRAIEAARCVANLSHDVTAIAQVATRNGGLRRAVLSTGPHSEWWNRLRISSEGSALRYALITDRARTEVDLVSSDRGLADQFLGQATGSTRTDSRLASTLFELLVPNRLKEESLDVDRLVLMVDQESARYPWEMMNQLSVKAGMIRQLETDQFRASAPPCGDRVAMVVGNPAGTGLPDLPAAATEARRVVEALSAHSVPAFAQIETDAMSIISDLHARCYRILHLAGHGVHTSDAQGMLIGGGTILTAGMIAQMRTVPELVFINCCHLGRTDGSPSPHHFAANLSVEFIQMGVRAVIAAGWSVDDAAACTFADAFYRAFLAGETFGESVRRARVAAFEAHLEVNTWGAYQCYGDPEYRFSEFGSGAGDPLPPPLVVPAQAVIELDNLREETRILDPRIVRGRLDAILSQVPESWRRRSDLRHSLALLHDEMGHYETAIELFAQCVNGIRTRELNLRVRSASRRGDVVEIDRCIDQLKENCNGSEELAILASAYKRRSALTKDRNSIEEMAAAYFRAYMIDEPREYSDLWINWQLAEVVLGRRTPDSEELNRHLELAKTHAKDDPCFWNSVAIPDCLLLQAIANKQFSDLEQVLTLYRKAVDTFANRREALTIQEHLTWVSEMFPEAAVRLEPAA